MREFWADVARAAAMPRDFAIRGKYSIFRGAGEIERVIGRSNLMNAWRKRASRAQAHANRAAGDE